MSSDSEIVNIQDKCILLTAATEGEFRKLVEFRASLPPPCKVQIESIEFHREIKVFVVKYRPTTGCNQIYVPNGCTSIRFDSDKTWLYYANMQILVPSGCVAKSVSFIKEVD
jgi:hypothetical protein